MPVMSAFGLRRRRPISVWGIKPYDGPYPNEPKYSGEFTGFLPPDYSNEIAILKGKLEKEPMKKFYVGARHIGASIHHNSNADCTRATVEEAIADAKTQVRAGADCVVVVEIVAIIRREHPPVSVEMLRQAE